MKKILATAVASAALTFAGTSAQAASATYFNGFGGLAPSYEFTHDDGTKITATASAWDPNAKKTKEAYVGQYIIGLGVTNSVTEHQGWHGTYYSSNDGSHAVDGKGYDDTLWLNFDRAFDVIGAMFSYVDKNDDVKIVDENHNVLGNFDLGDYNFLGFAYLDLSSLNFSGTKIGFKATGNNDNFKVKGIKGSATPNAVPTPTAAAAGILGLGALITRRRRGQEAE